jgi:hypothetical protein
MYNELQFRTLEGRTKGPVPNSHHGLQLSDQKSLNNTLPLGEFKWVFYCQTFQTNINLELSSNLVCVLFYQMTITFTAEYYFYFCTVLAQL